MPLVQAVCTNCNANLQVDNTKEAAVCPYCGAAYIVEKAIQYYSVVNHIHANVVNIQGVADSGFEIRAGVLIRYTGSSIDVTIPEGVVKIGKNAFYQQEFISNVHLPEGVKEIDSHAFYGCRNLKQIRLPSTLTWIGTEAFSRTGLTSVKIPNGIQLLQGFRNCYWLREIDIPPSVAEIDELSDNQFTSFHIPDTVRVIGPSAFARCRLLEEVTLPSSLVGVDRSAFRECTSLKSVTLPGGVQWIQAYAFEGCKSLDEIRIPDGVEEIGIHAFENCTSLVKAVLPRNLSVVEQYLFSGCGNLEEVILPQCDFSEGESAFEGTAWLANKQKDWREKKLCDYCGGPLKGIFEKRCTQCGNRKRY